MKTHKKLLITCISICILITGSCKYKCNNIDLDTECEFNVTTLKNFDLKYFELDLLNREYIDYFTNRGVDNVSDFQHRIDNDNISQMYRIIHIASAEWRKLHLLTIMTLGNHKHHYFIEREYYKEYPRFYLNHVIGNLEVNLKYNKSGKSLYYVNKYIQLSMECVDLLDKIYKYEEKNKKK